MYRCSGGQYQLACTIIADTMLSKALEEKKGGNHNDYSNFDIHHYISNSVVGVAYLD